MKRVLVTEPLHDAGMDLLRQNPDIETVELQDIEADTIAAAMPGVQAIAVRSAYLTEDVLSNGNELEIVSRHGVGCDRVAVDYLSGRKIPVAIASGANAQSVAEHTLMLMLAAARELRDLDDLVRNGDWSARDNYRANDLTGATMLIVGFGRIGRRVAPLCRAFGMNVIVADIALDSELAESMGCEGIEDFKTRLPDADFVTLHVPLDENTQHLVSEAELASMKDGAILINCARGGIVDEAALAAALESGKIARAGVDVFVEEPPQGPNPLFARDDVILTPHNAAASHLSVQEMARMTAQNIIDHFDGKLRDDCIFNFDALKGDGQAN